MSSPQPKTNRRLLIEKLTARNYLAVISSTALIFAVIFGIMNPSAVTTALENPLVTYIMGTFNTVIVMVYVFYFRKPQSKEST